MKGKRVISLFLAVVLVLGMVSLSPPSAYAAPTTDGFGFDTSPPSDFDAKDGENPYGQGRVALNAKREIMVMGDNIAPTVYDANNPIGDKAAVTSLPDVIKATQNMRYKLLAFDPNGSGKDDHVACIAVEYISGSYAVKLWVLNAKTGKAVGKITLKDKNVWPGEDLEAVDLLSIAAGDMDGNGKDELYAFVPGDNTSSNKTNGKIVKIDAPWNSCTDYITLDNRAAGGAAVPLAMGDADGDGKDELAYTLFKKGTFPNNHELSVILKGENGQEEWNKAINWKAGMFSASKETYPAALAFGNLDGDNKEDLVVAIQGESSLTVYTYQFRQNRGANLSAEEKKINDVSNDFCGRSASSVPVVLCFAARGMSKPDFIFVNGSVLNENLGGEKYSGSDQIISAVAGNFDGNNEGRENVLYSYSGSYGVSGGIYSRNFGVTLVYGDSTRGRLIAANFPGIFPFSGYNYYMALAAPDVDDDTVFIEYRSKEYTFDNPKIISILQAAPYFEDLGDYYYDATGGTSFGTSSGSGGGSSQSTSVNAHATLKVGAEFGFIVTVAAYVETTASTEWSSEYSVMETTTLETKFNGGKQENNVVLLGIPVTMYTYDVYGPNGKGGYDKDQMVSPSQKNGHKK